jgi:hypothetical protein
MKDPRTPPRVGSVPLRGLVIDAANVSNELPGLLVRQRHVVEVVEVKRRRGLAAAA